ncbi:putative FBD-associated F-box protein At1g05080 isoform X1 [Raphanus sativus]|uniref:FBD-associated F-box protein At1g05080 isoform X1 n=1 Tax=Raphanus sativus TaxID=3726 RepID=A0A9W3DSJ0_RAPSA|nr:putative FBD-associated F-box protein At1g05080 isoform X1 [Raphanus sativus]
MADIDRISELHDDLLLKILSQVPTKKAVTTMVLSKRWGLVWTMVPKLKYKDTRKEGDKSVWCLINKSLQLHKACVLESLCIQVNHQFSKAEDVGKCVSYAVDHCVRELSLDISSLSQIVLLPPNVYASKTLVELILAGHRLVVDVPSLPCLPSLQKLILICVMYKDQNSHVRLLENCPALRHLDVLRDMSDNVSRFIVKVPSLNSFTYMQTGLIGDSGTSLVLDSPGLRKLSLYDHGLIKNMPHLDSASVSHSVHQTNDKFLKYFSSVAYCSAINFPRLIKFKLHLSCSNLSNSSLEPLFLFLHNSPILKVLTISCDPALGSKDLPLSWNQQSSVPGCLLSHLEIFVWEKFGGRRRQERECVAYILANSKCLKMARISPICSDNLEEKEKMVEDLKSMYRVSASSQLETPLRVTT